jgi:hypothetical protein
MNIEPWTLWAFVITVGFAVPSLPPGADAWTPGLPEPEAGR